MKLPKMKYASGIVKQQQVKFGGLNMTAGATDGEIVDMWNMTSDHYPVLATRPRRFKSSYMGTPEDLYCWKELCWVERDRYSEATKFHYNHKSVGTVSEGAKTFGAIGDWIIILPDKKAYNVTTGEYRSMEAKWEGEMLDFRDGTLYGSEAKANCIACPDMVWSDWFSPGDAVTISGCTLHPENNGSRIIREINGSELYFYENSFTVGTETGAMMISRTMPDLQFLCENNNRLWGCSGNTIYASRLGDPFNWECFDGLASDSFTVETGSQGKFTGCISYGGYPVFFKEDMIYKVYGSYPSNFELVDSASIGVAEGCHRSLAVAGEVLYYLSRNGVMAYTGGVPRNISEELGTEKYTCSAAGSDGEKYYISMCNREGSWGLYVYDTRRGLWHKEDAMMALAFARKGWDLYALDEKGTMWICGRHQEPEPLTIREDPIPWRVDFADFTAGTSNIKSMGKLQLRLELEENSVCRVSIMYDSDGVWHQVSEIRSQEKKQSWYLPIVPRRCDHFRLCLSGVGSCRIHSLVREFYVGSELNHRTGRN